MASKTIAITMEVADELDKLRGPGQSYDSIIRQIAGLAQNRLSTARPEHPDFVAMASLAVGGSCLLLFNRAEPVLDSYGNIPASWDSKPTNLQHLAQVVRRVQERLGYKLYVEGRPRGQMVTRIA